MDEDLRTVVREVMGEFFKARESLEQRMNELTVENEKNRAKAEAAERDSVIRAELQRAGVVKLDLAYRAIKDDIHRNENGTLVAQDGSEMRDYVSRFVAENPELLPARLAGGSGAGIGQRSAGTESRVDLDRIRPGMSPEEMERVRQEIARVASQTLRGL